MIIFHIGFVVPCFLLWLGLVRKGFESVLYCSFTILLSLSLIGEQA